MRGHVLTAVHADDNDPKSSSNPKNWRFCPSCQRDTVFQCPECLEWHEVRHLSLQPYVCPTAVSVVRKKLTSTLFDPMYRCFGLLALWLMGNFVVGIWYAPEWYGRFLLITGGLTIFAIFLVLFCLEPFINQKRTAKFAKEFPTEWSILQRLQK
jgi:hypothetical protein